MSQHPSFAPNSAGSRDGDTTRAYQLFQQAAAQNTTATNESNSTIQQAALAPSGGPRDVDLQMLAGLPPEQIAAIGRLFLSGAMHLPQTTNVTEPQPLPSATAAAQNTVSPNDALENGELEDGELDDGAEGESRPWEASLYSQQGAPKSNFTPSDPISSKRGLSTADADMPPAKRLQSSSQMPDKQSQLRTFIRIMNEHGHGFTQIREYVTDKRQLENVYVDLSLPLESGRGLSQSGVVNGAKPNSSSTLQHTTSIFRRPSLSHRQPSSKVEPAKNRSEYLARLQAAKSKKPDNPPIKPSHINGAASSTMKDTQLAATTQRRNVDPEKNRMLRERLAALQAQQAQKEQQAKLVKNGSNNSRGLGAGLANISATVSTQPMPAIPTSSTQSKSLGKTSFHAPSSAGNDKTSTRNHVPFDARARHPNHQQLVIDISEEDVSDFDSDVESDAEDEEGVSLPLLEQQASRLLDQSQAGMLSSGPVTPGTLSSNVNAYEKKLQEIEQAKQRLAALQAKANNKSEMKRTSTSVSAEDTPDTIGDSAEDAAIVSTHEIESIPQSQAELAIPQRENEQSTAHLPGLASFHDDTNIVLEAAQAADVDMADDEGAADDDFDSVYQSTNEIDPISVTHLQNKADDVDLGLDTDDSGASKPDQAMQSAVIEGGHDDDSEGDESIDFYGSDDKKTTDSALRNMPTVENASEESDDDASSMDISESEAEDSQLEEEQDATDGVGDVDSRTVSDQDVSGPAIVQEDLEDEIATNQEQDEVQDVDSALSANASRFASYESPLSMLKDYRFNPDFTNLVKGGYKSITYSHKIDPNIPLCPYEMQDGQCRNVGCHFQHFADVQLTESEVLQQLVSSHAGSRDQEEEQAWQSGLQTILNDMRQLGSKLDINTIAARLVEYRRNFDRQHSSLT